MSKEIVAQNAELESNVQLAINTICKGLTKQEADLFMQICKKTGLDPVSKQIYAIKRKTKTGTAMTVQTSIDGLRAIASRTGELDGQDGPFWCGEDGEWKDVWLSSKLPAAAKVIVYRKNCRHPFIGTVLFKSFKPEGFSMWTKMPEHMLAKCAEAQALRKAFPEALSGIYEDSEMDQAGDLVIQVDAEPIQSLPERSAQEAIKGSPYTASDTQKVLLNKMFDKLNVQNGKKKLISDYLVENKVAFVQSEVLKAIEHFKES